MSLHTDPRPQLRGRASECAALDALLQAARSGESRTLVLRGEAGVGKTALLEYAAMRSEGCRVVRAVGVESEMELPFAAVHQLAIPLLEGVERLPSPQRGALETAFGLRSGPPPDRFLVGLALLTLLSEDAEARPLVCLVDDSLWLDRSSAQVLSFVARRLHAESVVMVFAERDGDEQSELAGLPELRLLGLPDADATELVATVTLGPLDESVRNRILAEARGNPLALLELARGRSSASLAGGFAVPGGLPLPRRIEASFRRRVARLPSETQQILLVAAADPVGDPTVLWRAVSELGSRVEAAAPAESDDLLEIGARVAFRHPLLRSAIYGAASPEERRGAHRALAAATDPEIDPDRRAWHRAHAALAPDEEIALELERSAGRAQARGGLAATAAFLQRSVALTQEPARRADRALAAAQANLQAGASDAALGLLAAAEAESLNELQRARVDLLRGQIASATNAGGEAPAQLLKAAKRLEPLDVALARGTYLDAWGAALFAGSLAHAGGTLLEVSRAARAAPRPTHAPGPCDLLLDGLAALIIEGRAAAAPPLRRAVRAFRGEEVSAEQWFQWGVLASSAAVALWDFESWDAVSSRQIELARGAGALTLLSIALNGQGMISTWCGELETAASLSAEDEALKEATGTRIAPYGAMLLAAYRGRTAEASTLTGSTIEDAVARGEGLGIELARWTTAVLDNGHGRYKQALAAAEQASEETPRLFISAWALPELIEAAVRSGKIRLAADALQRLAEATEACDTDWAAGIEARSRALLTEGEVAEGLYREAIDRLGRTRLRPELARAQLLYGEWLRRENRRVDAREQLRGAYDVFTSIGADGFADRARRELLATGEKVRTRTAETRDELTPQEEQIARLARDGLSNPEIGARLFLSPRTVEWHLHKVFTKLGISSRKQVREVLAAGDRS